MDFGNRYLTEELWRMRHEELQRELAHERFMAGHGLDLWSVLRRAIASLLPKRRAMVAPATASRERERATRRIAA